MKENRRVSLSNVFLLMSVFVLFTGCAQANQSGKSSGDGTTIDKEQLKGVWELYAATSQQTSNIFLYFDGTKMYSAVKAGEQFAAVPQGTPF